LGLSRKIEKKKDLPLGTKFIEAILKSLFYTSQNTQGVLSRKKHVFSAVYGNGQYLDHLFCSYTLERDITGTQRRGFKIFKQLQLQERDKLKIDPRTKTEWKEYYGYLRNDQDSKGEKVIEEEGRSEGTDDNEDMITIEELN
jgi:hypothetical protein